MSVKATFVIDDGILQDAREYVKKTISNHSAPLWSGEAQ
jgi:hypothetical protein